VGAALVNFVLGPFLGMLYLGRAKLAFGYLALMVVLSSLTFFYLFPIIAPSHDNLTVWLLSLPIRIIGTVHGTAIAKSRSKNDPLPHYSRWYSLFVILLGFLLAALFIRAFFYQPFDAPSESMEPSVNVGDYFFVSKRAFDSTDPQRGDIVVFHRGDGDYVKRIVGVPGDRVQMQRGVLILNGERVPRHRLIDFSIPYGFGVVGKARQYMETLPSGRTYRTLDLADNNPQDNTSIFVVPQGHYFILGDNRDNSEDSRFDEVGYVPRENIIGKVVVKFADRQHKTMIWEPVD
jgi:signal peptidase I